MWPIFLFVAMGATTGNNKAGCLVHAVVVSVIALVHVPSMLNADASGASVWGRRSACFTLCYMLYDLRYITHWTYHVHHTITITATAYVMYTSTYANLVLLLDVNEVSSIFFALLAFGIWPRAMRTLFAVSFVACRSVWLVWGLWTKEMGRFPGALLRAHYALNTYWLFQIARRLRRSWRHKDQNRHLAPHGGAPSAHREEDVRRPHRGR